MDGSFDCVQSRAESKKHFYKLISIYQVCDIDYLGNDDGSEDYVCLSVG